MSQIKLVITIPSGKVVEKYIFNCHEISKESISESKEKLNEPLTH